MTVRPDSHDDSYDDLETKLTMALEATDEDRIKYHLRQALQLQIVNQERE